MAGERPGPAPLKPQGFGLETQTGPAEYAPGYAETKPLALHTQEGGKGPLKGPGLQLSGVVEGVEQKNGVTTIRYEMAGRAEAVSFPTRHEHEGGQDVPNPLCAVADGLKGGDHFGLRIGRDGAAVLANDTQGLETRVQPDGQVMSKALEAPVREIERGITRDTPY